MVVDALTLANGELSISASIQEPAKFLQVIELKALFTVMFSIPIFMSLIIRTDK